MSARRAIMPAVATAVAIADASAPASALAFATANANANGVRRRTKFAAGPTFQPRL